MPTRYAVWFAFPLAFGLLLGCSGPPPEPTEAPPPPPPATTIPEPTGTRLPTSTPKPTATPLAEGVLFRDEFNDGISAEWQWENEVPERWELTDEGWLRILGDAASLLGDEYQNNLLWHDLPSGDFVITAHLRTAPFENFQQTTIYIYEDPDNYIALNRGFCDICLAGGGGFFMEYKVSGDAGAYQIATDAQDVYLRLESNDEMISGFYATEPDGWERIGRFGNYFQFSRVGIGVTNVNASQDVVGEFDWIEIAVPE